MSNMSYCRFENTLRDLRDCWEHMDETDLSEAESKARERLLSLITTIHYEFGEDE